MFQKNFDGVIMLKWFLISAACLGLCMILECASASCDSQNFSHTSDPEELNKPLLDENSPENEFAKRTIVFLDGKKTKPQNLNTKPNQMMEFENYDNHLPPKTEDKPGGDRKRNRGKRIFIKEDALNWPNKTIPYKINYGSYQNHTIIHIVMALAVYKFNRASCVRWVPHTNQPYYVEVIGNSAWCRTVPGFRRYKVHPLHISEKYCTSVSSALHEMMHVAGAVHEQSRSSDRYRVLNFRWAQIPKMDEPNYMGSDVSNARQYDLGSILQYQAGPGKAIYLNDPDLEYLTRLRHIDLSFYDKAELNAFYKCANPDHCAIYSICQNDGYLKRVGGLCYCECVDGLSGRDCTDVFTCPGCGGTINLSAGGSEMIDMVGYKTGVRCTWLIKGPEKTTIQVYINSLGLPMSRKRNCYHYIEIRDYLSGSRGKIICGNSSGETFTKKNLGPTNTMIVRFNSLRFKTLDPGNGFALTVTAVPSACSSSPCKYPATCKDGAHIDSYTCLCTEGYSGTNCDTVAANATVTDSFERDFSTLMKHGSSGVDFKWSTKKYWNLHDVNITAFDGYLMAILVNTFRASYFPYDSVAKLETSVVFERANRCLRFNYALANNDHVGYFRTTLTVRISSDSGTSNVVFNTTTGNKWASVGINLRAVNNMKIVFKGVYGYQHLALDNIRITPLLCRAVNPCDDVVCQNGGTCGIVVNNSTLIAHSQCSCQFGFSGQYCEKYICTEESCLNGACFPLSSSTYTCDCFDGWSGDRCEIYTCANVQCNQGRCEALSETETRCICDNGWHGQFCDSTSDY